MFKIFKHLLPDSPIWNLVIDRAYRKFIKGLSNGFDDTRNYLASIYTDLLPALTRELPEWEKTFGLPNNGTEQIRRQRLDAAWKALGGQSPRYIQDVLQAAGFDVYVHEWWKPIPGRPQGGSINGDVVPQVCNPVTYLDDGVNVSVMQDGGSFSQDGNVDSMDDSKGEDKPGYPLVNKIYLNNRTEFYLSDGSINMQEGHWQAMDGLVDNDQQRKLYDIPTDPAFWPYFLYIGGENFPDVADVPLDRKEEFEDLCLKICPAQQWLGLLINYV